MSAEAVESPAGPMAYTCAARVLHWVVAVLVLTMIPLGIVIANEWGGERQQALYDLHKSIGAILVPIIFIRVVYRLMNPPGPLPADLSEMQRTAAHATHMVLYALLVLQPMIGWIGTSAYPAPMPVFGLFNMPHIWPDNRALSESLFVVHRWLGIIIAIVAGMHIAAALHHHFVRKDRILMRMISGR